MNLESKILLIKPATKAEYLKYLEEEKDRYLNQQSYVAKVLEYLGHEALRESSPGLFPELAQKEPDMYFRIGDRVYKTYQK